eukprot:scaffold6057_cov66-Attheya_sp.AAC.1
MMIVSPRHGLILHLHSLLADVLHVGRAHLVMNPPHRRTSSLDSLLSGLSLLVVPASSVVPCEKYSPLLVEIPSVIPPLL